MSVELDPPDLGFRRPFNQEVQQSLHLTNPGNDPVAFKVKTTAPKQYCVRPNSGRIEPGKTVEVQVLLQAMKEDPPPEAKCRDKFLVQSVAVTTDKEFSNVAAIWQNVEKTSKSSIQEKKIRVSFLPAINDGGYTQHTVTPTRGEIVNGNTANHNESPPAYNSPEAQSSLPFPLVSSSPSRLPPPPPEKSDPILASKSASTPASTPSSSAATTVTNGASSVASTATSSTLKSSEDLKTQLAKAHKEIAALKEKLAEQSGLKQRKSGESIPGEFKTSPQLMVQGAPGQEMAGVPVQIVAGLCLLSFLLAYFFF